MGVDVGALSVRIASLKGYPRTAAIRIGVHWAGAYGKATMPTSQHNLHSRSIITWFRHKASAV